MASIQLEPGSELCLHTRVVFRVVTFHSGDYSDPESMNKFASSLILQASVSADNISTDQYHSYSSITL